MEVITQVPNRKHMVTADQRKIATMRAAGLEATMIARLLSITEETVMLHLSRPHVRSLVIKLGCVIVDELRPIIDLVKEDVRLASQEAFEANLEVLRFSRAEMHTGNIKAAALCGRTAENLLERVGISAPKQVEVKSTNVNLGGEDLKALKGMLEELDAVEKKTITPEYVLSDEEQEGRGGVESGRGGGVGSQINDVTLKTDA